MEATSERATEQSRRSAAGVLRRVFGGAKPGVHYRLWDGSEGEVGEPDGSFTLVIRDREAFRRAFGSHNTRVMAEAFIDNQIDVDGDLFEALRVANQLEDLELGWLDKLGIYLDLRRV
jgi:cyclopropane-fatty-acyl-phospholipid synthase